MTPVYQLRVWEEDGWWLARVISASQNADPAPLNALTQARSLARIESMGRDLIATILDAAEETFQIDVQFILPDDASDHVCEAKAARAWLDSAQELWLERSAGAARALAGKGYSLRETATLLGLSHQRVDQLLVDHVGEVRSNIVLVESRSWHLPGPPVPSDVDALLVIRRNSAERGTAATSPVDTWVKLLRDRFTALFLAEESRSPGPSDAAECECVNADQA
ncbi:MAG TPA: hypothetical protein VGI31_04435 [Streptosporangiaceae bacterium]